MEFETQDEFFKVCGERWLRPYLFGECLYPITVEEMYQHFKARMIQELCVKSSELLEVGELSDRSGRMDNV